MGLGDAHLGGVCRLPIYNYLHDTTVWDIRIDEGLEVRATAGAEHNNAAFRHAV